MMARALAIGLLLHAAQAARAAEAWSPTSLREETAAAFAEAGGSLFAGTAFAGLQGSGGDGSTWSRIPGCRPESNASVPAVHASPGMLAAAFEGEDACLSADGGATWEPPREGLPAQPFIRDFERIGDMLLAGLDGSSGGAPLYRTAIAGGAWRPEAAGFDTAVSGIVRLARDADGTVYAAVTRRRGNSPWLYLSADTGATWRPLDSTLAGPVYDLAWTEGFLLAASARGIFRTPDKGATWEDCGPDFTAQPAMALAARPGLVLAGAGNAVYRSQDAGGSWLALPHGLPSDTGTSVEAVWAGRDVLLASMGRLRGVYRMPPPATGLRPAPSRAHSPRAARPAGNRDAAGRLLPGRSPPVRVRTFPK